MSKDTLWLTIKRFVKQLEEGGESLVCWRIDSTQKKDKEFKETHKRWIVKTSWQVHRSEFSYQAIACDRQGLWMSTMIATAAPRPPSVLPLSWLQTFRSPVHSINRLDSTIWKALFGKCPRFPTNVIFRSFTFPCKTRYLLPLPHLQDFVHAVKATIKTPVR